MVLFGVLFEPLHVGPQLPFAVSQSDVIDRFVGVDQIEMCLLRALFSSLDRLNTETFMPEELNELR